MVVRWGGGRAAPGRAKKGGPGQERRQCAAWTGLGIGGSLAEWHISGAMLGGVLGVGDRDQGPRAVQLARKAPAGS